MDARRPLSLAGAFCMEPTQYLLLADYLDQAAVITARRTGKGKSTGRNSFSG